MVVMPTPLLSNIMTDGLTPFCNHSNFMVERPHMVRWVVGSIARDGPIELFIDPASVPRLE